MVIVEEAMLFESWGEIDLSEENCTACILSRLFKKAGLAFFKM